MAKNVENTSLINKNIMVVATNDSSKSKEAKGSNPKIKSKV